MSHRPVIIMSERENRRDCPAESHVYNLQLDKVNL